MVLTEMKDVGFYGRKHEVEEDEDEQQLHFEAHHSTRSFQSADGPGRFLLGTIAEMAACGRIAWCFALISHQGHSPPNLD